MNEDDFTLEVSRDDAATDEHVLEASAAELSAPQAELLDAAEARRAVEAAHASEPETTSHAAQAEARTTVREFVRTKSRGKRFSRVYEQGEQLEVKIRPARTEDLERITEIDLAAYADSYKQAHEEPEASVEMLRRRFETIQRYHGQRWMLVAEVDGVVEGFMVGQPTTETHEELVSWYESTDQGTLEKTYDPKGKQLYIVNLTVTQRGSKHGVGSMLIGNMYGSLLQAGIRYAFFSSRMPGFRSWAAEQSGRSIEPADPARVQELAEEYWQLRRPRDGKRKDWQLRMYEADGFKLMRLVPHAYDDPHSLDYGVVAVADNPLPKWLRLKPINWAAGGLLKLAVRSPKLANNLF